MNTPLLIAALLIAHAVLGYCGDNEDNYRQYDCPYMWMMMNAGPQLTGLDPLVLLCLGIGTVLLSRELMTASWVATDRPSCSKKTADAIQELLETM